MTGPARHAAAAALCLLTLGALVASLDRGPRPVALAPQAGPSPARETLSSATAPPPSNASDTARLDVNIASAAQLELLPHIGPALAARIVDDRAANGPFRSIADLDRVKGIGPRTIERIAPFIRVGEPAAQP